MKLFMKRLMRPFWVVLALCFLLEAWLWDVLRPVVARIVNVIPWGRIRPAFVTTVERLSPRMTLVVFAIPFVVLLPIKFLEFWLLTHRQWISAIIILVAAKLVGLGLTAFIFDVTKDKLLQMPWFQRVYDFVMWARGWAHEKVEPVRQQLKAWSHATIDPVIRRLRQWRRMLQPRRAGRLLQRVLRIRRRMRTTATPAG
jgi:hypothetical protein